MDSFLHSLASHLHDKYPEHTGDLTIVFPNRRAGVFFKHYLKEVLASPAWLPEIHTINSFMEELSGLTYADPIDVSFELYQVYRGLVSKPGSYDEFYYWGEMMISDFNDVDKYMVNAEDLFSNMTDLKAIDNVFDYLSEEQKELISRFWSQFNPNDLSQEQESFLGIWKLLFPLYTGLSSRLFAGGTGTEGMIYRRVAEKMIAGDYPSLRSGKVMICGFNALSMAEKYLFRYLRDSGKGEFYWDYDQRYVRGEISEAARFIRANLEDFPPDPDFPDDFDHLSGPKAVRVFNLPSDVLQTKKLHQLLSDLELPQTGDFTHTAIVLGDEELLQPVLSSLPANIEKLNITMGYPLKNTPVFSFLENLLRLQRNMALRADNQGKGFYYRDVLPVLNHQYVRSVSGDEARAKVSEINRLNMIYVDPSFFADDRLLFQIFRKCGQNEMTGYLSGILDRLAGYFRDREAAGSGFGVENEFIFHIRTRLNKLEQIFDRHPEASGIETFARLFRKIMNTARIPFEGEPLQGIQVMGILETRLLDFENLVILSLNEGVMPAGTANLSYVPANLRYAFGMPTREDKDAIYAYYFYRLMQRASRVNIMYNSRAEGIRSGEPSRYIYQLKYLFGYDLHDETVSFSIGEKTPAPISIQKTDEVMNRLSAYSEKGSKKLSPTSLTTFLECPLRFYFTYIAGIREEEEADEEVDASGFGQLLHKTMELLYDGYAGKMINREDLERIGRESNIRTCLDEAFRRQFYRYAGKDPEIRPEGRNIIVYEVIRKMAGAVIRYDASQVPFMVRKLEEEVSALLRIDNTDIQIRLGGTIDRLDETGNRVRIVDYKTGRADTTVPSLELLFDRDAWPSGKKFKGVLQTFIYSWLYGRQSPGAAVQPELYVAGEIFSEKFSSAIFLKEGGSHVVDDFNVHAEKFEGLLKELLNELFDPRKPFSQTEDEKRCQYCPYAGICHRPVRDR